MQNDESLEEMEDDVERPNTLAEATEGQEMGDLSTVTGPEVPGNANEDLGDISTQTGFENVEVDDETGIQEWGDDCDGDVAQVASSSTQNLDSAEISVSRRTRTRNEQMVLQSNALRRQDQVPAAG